MQKDFGTGSTRRAAREEAEAKARNAAYGPMAFMVKPTRQMRRRSLVQLAKRSHGAGWRSSPQWKARLAVT